jgi:hypothetical protein
MCNDRKHDHRRPRSHIYCNQQRMAIQTDKWSRTFRCWWIWSLWERLGTLGFFWIVDEWCLDELVGRQRLSRFNLDRMDQWILGQKCALDIMDSLLCYYYCDSLFQDHDDVERWRDKRYNWDDFRCESRAGHRISDNICS